MIKKNKSKKIILFILISIAIILMIYNQKNHIRREEILELKLPKAESNINSVELSDNAILLYNVIYIPMNNTFSQIFGSAFKPNENLTINYNGMEIEIDNIANKIIIPNITQNSNDQYDNSVEIEIEIYNNNKYIPIYLISNLPRTLVTINGKNVYTSSNYKNSVDVYMNEKENKIIIYRLDKENDEQNNKYFGQQDGALWREEAIKRIEKYRKNTKKIVVNNQNGNKINNAKIVIHMKRNFFKFGTAIRYFEKKGQNNYSGINNTIFNTIGTENGLKSYYTSQYGFKIIKDIIKFSKENNMGVRGHLLFADYNFGQFDDFISNINEEDSLAKINEEYKENKITYNEAEERMKKMQGKFEDLVLDSIKKYTSELKDITEWDVVNSPDLNQFYKYYLFEKNGIKDDSFTSKRLTGIKFINNEEYNKFMASCFETARKNSKNARLILNFNKINGSEYYKELATKITSNIGKYTNDIDAIGVQYHVMNYDSSPVSYYNSINYILNKTGVKNAEITEFDNRNDIKEKEVRSKYLKDTLITAYSNKNIDEFYMWVYNSDTYFTKEERKAYEETVYPWINYSEDGESTDGTYSTRLYKGTYEATVTLPNGKSQAVNFEVSDDSNDTINVVFDSELQSIEINETPKTDYYRGDAIDLTTGSITAKYDDGTSKEIRLSDNDVKILNFNTTNNGKCTLTVQYNGCNTTFDINVKENITADINKIIEKNNSIRNDYASIYTNTEVANAYNNFINTAKTISKNEDENSLEKLDRLYSAQTEIARAIVKEYNKKTINIENSNYAKLISDILDISNDYKVLYELYVTNDSLSNKDAENKINQVIERYNSNTDIDLSNETNLINQMRALYSTVVSDNNIADNYLDKQRIFKTCEIVSLMLENDIKPIADAEYNTITISSDKGINNFTNQDETITINLPKKASITSESSNGFKFTANGTKDVKLSIRGYEYTYTIKVTNIDKTSPKVTAQNGQSLKINVTDDNLKEIKIEKDGKETAVNNGQTITIPGIYKITVTDKAGNTSKETAIVYGTYANEQNSQVNYITIKAKTKVSDIKQVGDYTVKDNNSMAAGIKRAPSQENTEKDNNSYIATGDILQENNNTYIFVTLGDLSSNGDVGAADLIKLRKRLVGLTKLTKLQELAADTNQNGSVNVSDLLKERKIMVGME